MSAKASLGLLVLFVIVLGVLRSADSLAPAGGRRKIQLSFWNGWTGPDGRAMLQVIRRFTKENPDIDVTMQRMEWATYYNKLIVAGLDGRGPEVFVVHASALPRMVRGGFVAPADDLYAGQNCIPPSDFEPYVLDQMKYDGHYMGLPLDIHPQGLYCNADLLKKAGIVDEHGQPRPPRNRKEFLKAAQAMKLDPTNSGHPDQWGYALTVWRNNFQALLPQFGGRYLDAQGRADLACPGNVAALDFIGSLSTRYHLAPPAENALGWVGFRQGKVGMVFDGVYMIGDILRLNDLKVIGAPMPVIGSRPGTVADSHVLCIRKGLNPETRAAAEKFIRFLSANSIDWAAAGQVPARRSVRNTPAFRNMQVQYAFSKQIPYMVYPPRTTVLFEMNTELDLAVEKVVRGRTSAAEALAVANKNVQGFLDREREEAGP